MVVTQRAAPIRIKNNVSVCGIESIVISNGAKVKQLQRHACKTLCNSTLSCNHVILHMISS